MSHYLRKILTYLIFLVTANYVSEDIIMIIMMTRIIIVCVSNFNQNFS